MHNVNYLRMRVAGTSQSYRLNEINVPVYSHAQCQAIWGADSITVRQVCMGTATESACGVRIIIPHSYLSDICQS